jgi:4'-phosphopantetheinyl transferase
VSVPARRQGWPDPADVDVWELRLDAPPRALRNLEAVLSGEERARADRFVFAVDRDRYVAAHGLLRHVLAGYSNQMPARLRFVRATRGKPRLEDPEDLCFNLSHSEGVGVLAVTLARQVGIDVEAVRPLADLEDLVATCLSPSERTRFEALPELSRLPAFYEAWTRKEALLKALGEGLSRPLDSFDVTLGPGEPAGILSVVGAPASAELYALRALRPAEGFVGALAVGGTEARVRLRGRVSPEELEETDGSRGAGGEAHLHRGRQPGGAIRLVARGQGDPEGVARRREERLQDGLSGVHPDRLDRHDAGEPAADRRGQDDGRVRRRKAHASAYDREPLEVTRP